MQNTTKQILAIALVTIMVASAGCAGWGQDGPADQDDTNGSDTNDDSGQEQNDAEQDNGSGESTDGSDGGGDGDTDSSSGDSDSSKSSSDSSGDSSDSDSSDDSDGGGSDDGISDTQPQESDSSDGGSTDADSSSDSKHADDTDEDGSDKQSSQPPANGGDGSETPPENGDGNETPPDDGDQNETDSEPEPEGNTVTVDVRHLDTDEPVDIPVRLNGIDTDYDETVTATNGTVTFENVPNGDYEVKVATDGWWPEYPGMNEVTVSGDTSYTLGVHDAPDSHTLTVTVTDAETGDPIEGADVSGVGGRHPDGADLLLGGETNANGVLTVDAYESGYLISVSADGYEYPPNQEVDLDEDKSVSFELTPEDSGGETATQPSPETPANETNENAAAA